MKRMCSGKSSNIRSANTTMDSLKFVKPAQSKSALSSLFRVEKAKNVAKSDSVSPDLSAPRDSEKKTEKSTSEQLKSNPIFHYHLSHLEEYRFGQSRVFPMKSVPAAELQLLRNGQRISYLERRYERSPDDKYNYPEATSWRYGWFHRESDPFQKRVPRRD
ncbi:hypothetical protein M5D96_007301 [Drosophila gunungcola]|uniref:Sperm microtubule inner protein 1 C-terminal domain-containing protein n=1 Tax=Drosophila gunungcola TaxID=103775 RepID=A0A9Q0BPX9_9MUSC|nr:hypothetical protein M5D96_007301 [Drosophila gunungcola]